ncbi:GFA family protein [Acaryochloris marina NIES-2412]|uniref:GFA family protein n=1 Tax=Acaryochloris marina TaxID=155978 RepID=UPI004059AC6A
MQKLSGCCLCEGIAYEISSELGPILTAIAQNVGAGMELLFGPEPPSLPSNLSGLKGEELLSRYHSSEFVVKHFCSICGSNLISTYDNEPDKIGIPLGGLDQGPHNEPEGHIYVGSKSPWFTITDDLPQHDTWPGSYAKVRETR